jgi:hypothetical protein
MLALITIPTPSLYQTEALVYEDFLGFSSKAHEFDDKLITLIAQTAGIQEFFYTACTSLGDHPRGDYMHHINSYLQAVWDCVYSVLAPAGLSLIPVGTNQGVYGKVYTVRVKKD